MNTVLTPDSKPAVTGERARVRSATPQARSASICFMGAALDTGNMGVSALSTSLVHLALKSFPRANIFLFLGNRSSNAQKIDMGKSKVCVEVVNYRQNPASKLGENVACLLLLALLYRFLPFNFMRSLLKKTNSRLRRLAEADFVGDIRGGDSFSDIYGLFNFLRGTIPSFMALLLQQRLVLLPQTYGPYRSPVARRIAAFVLTRAARAFSRDRSGVGYAGNLLASSGRRQNPVQFCPDVAFALGPVVPDNQEIIPPLPKDGRPLVGFNISGLLYNGGFTRNNMFKLKFNYREFVHALAERLLATTNARLLLVPHTFAGAGHVESDPDACGQVQSALAKAYPHRVHLVAREYDAMRIKYVIGLSDFFIGSRMHACIAALSQGIPTVGVAYSPKFYGVFDSIGAADLVVDACMMGAEEAMDKICHHFLQRQSLQPRIAAAGTEARLLLERTFEELLTGCYN